MLGFGRGPVVMNMMNFGCEMGKAVGLGNGLVWVGLRNLCGRMTVFMG